jgi:hypothetical protein
MKLNRGVQCRRAQCKLSQARSSSCLVSYEMSSQSYSLIYMLRNECIHDHLVSKLASDNTYRMESSRKADFHSSKAVLRICMPGTASLRAEVLCQGHDQ